MAFRLERWVDLVSETQPFLYELPLFARQTMYQNRIKELRQKYKLFSFHKIYLHL